jgi:hypothetical protein
MKLKIEKTFVKLLTTLMLIYSLQLNVTEVSGLYEDEAIPSSHNLPLTHENICQVEYTVVKTAVGHCLKIGRGMRGCIAGTFFHPYHPDCI